MKNKKQISITGEKMKNEAEKILGRRVTIADIIMLLQNGNFDNFLKHNNIKDYLVLRNNPLQEKNEIHIDEYENRRTGYNDKYFKAIQQTLKVMPSGDVTYSIYLTRFF